MFAASPSPTKPYYPSNRLSVFSLVMINVIAVASLRSLPFGAKLGAKLISYYGLGLLGFLIPVGLVTAELATTWPEQGGIYVWVKLAFGVRLGFLSVWLQWIYNLVWYPTILCFVAATLAFVFEPSLTHHKFYTFCIIQVLFWGATCLNCLGLQVSSRISTLGTLLGTLLPFVLISLLTLYWLFKGYPSQLQFSHGAWLPELNDFKNLNMFTLILFGLMGLEMSAVHAHEVRNPTRDYPKALLISSILIIVVLVWGSCALGIVVPVQDLNLITGVPQAYQIFLNKLGLTALTPWIALSMVGGAVASVATWIIGPTQGLLVASLDTQLPSWLTWRNRFQAPVGLLVLQASLVTLISTAYLYSASIESIYFVLAELTSQFALLMYLLFFACVIKLRRSHPHINRPFRVPGGKMGLWIVVGLGAFMTLLGIVMGFTPPPEFQHLKLGQYQLMSLVGLSLGCCPVLFLARTKP